LRAYFDTSALLPVYVPEELSDKSVEWFAAADEIYVSRLTEVEFYSALARKIRMREFDAALAKRVTETFARHLHTGLYSTLRLSNKVFDLSSDYLTGLNSNLRTLDALHLACCAHSRLTLITADKSLADCAGQFDVPGRLIA